MLFIIIAISGDLTGRRREAISASIYAALFRTLCLPLGTKHTSVAAGYTEFSLRKHLWAEAVVSPLRHR